MLKLESGFERSAIQLDRSSISAVSIQQLIHASVHLHHEGPREGPSARPRRPQGHLAVVSSRRQDRRARPERRRARARCCGSWRARISSFLGEAFPAEGISVGFLQQEPRLDPAKTVLGNVEEGVAEIRALLNRYDEINAKFGEELSPDEMDKVLDEQGKVQDRIEAANGWDLDSRLELAMDALRLPPPDADVTTLSGGERRRVALCRLLLRSPDLLLLDEPTNHLDAESVAWLERFLKDYAGTVVAVTHDRYFLDNVAGWILELDRGSGIPWEGNYSSWLEQKQKRLEVEEKQETQAAAHAAARARLDPHVAARAAGQGQGAPQRLRRPAAAKRRRRRSSRSRSTSRPARGSATSSSRRAACARRYGDLLLMDDVSFTLPRGGIVGVIGPNGAGKTTLFRMITGQEQPDGGTLRLGETVQVGYVDQSRDALGADKTVWEEITGGGDEVELGKRAVASRAYVSWFNFKGRDQQRKVGALSGGERNRVHLAKLLKGGRATCCCSTSRPTTSTSTRCARSKKRCSRLPAAPSSSATIAGSSIASPRTCWRSKATARWSGSRATTRTTKPIASAGSAPKPISRTGSSTGS